MAEWTQERHAALAEVVARWPNHQYCNVERNEIGAALDEIERLEESNESLRNEIAAIYNIPGVSELVENDT